MSEQWGFLANTAQFLGGISQAIGRLGRQKLHNFLEELVESLTAKTTQFLEGTGSWLLGHLVVETEQFLEGTGNLLLGDVGEINYTDARRSSC